MITVVMIYLFIYFFVCFRLQALRHHPPPIGLPKIEKKSTFSTPTRFVFYRLWKHYCKRYKEGSVFFFKLTNYISIFEQQNFNKNRNKIILQKAIGIGNTVAEHFNQ